VYLHATKAINPLTGYPLEANKVLQIPPLSVLEQITVATVINYVLYLDSDSLYDGKINKVPVTLILHTGVPL
jgi:hypothetical protein